MWKEVETFLACFGIVVLGFLLSICSIAFSVYLSRCENCGGPFDNTRKRIRGWINRFCPNLCDADAAAAKGDSNLVFDIIDPAQSQTVTYRTKDESVKMSIPAGIGAIPDMPILDLEDSNSQDIDRESSPSPVPPPPFYIQV